MRAGAIPGFFLGRKRRCPRDIIAEIACKIYLIAA